MTQDGQTNPPSIPWPALPACLADLEQGLLQRDVAARALLLAALAGEHVLLLGPPGTAKSELARRLHQLLQEARYFERLLTRFTVPEELFGPLSLRALEDDRYERLTDGYLPSADVAFLDEVFKANSAILNTLLGLLHERSFDNGTRRIDVPLVCLIGASNEMPDEEGLMAFYDRFLLRVPVLPVDDAHFEALLHLGTTKALPSAHIHHDELEDLRRRAETVRLPATVLQALRDARLRAAERQSPVSDRRWCQIAALLKVQAASRGVAEVNLWDTWVLPFVLAGKPEDMPAWEADFLRNVAHAEPLALEWLERAVQAFEQQLEIEQRAPADNGSEDGAGKIALARSIAGPSGDSELVRLVSEHARKHYGSLHIEARVAQVDTLLARLQPLVQEVRAQSAAVLAAAQAHAWLPPSWRTRIVDEHQRRNATLDSLHARLQACRGGFTELPLDRQLDQPAPRPVVWAE